MVLARLLWTDRKGGCRMEQGDAARLAKRLETLRRPADLWVVDDHGVMIETIGGCEEADGRNDDKRVRWIWWYDKSAIVEQYNPAHDRADKERGWKRY